jgi:kynurenine formamidase|tara:strand:+ start:196 stop:528 length:333 start_codon:yes stop_codon:yes gene_type:complete
MLEKGCGITVVDHQTVVAAHGIDDAGQGDVVLFRTSRDSLWKNSRTVNKGAAEIAANNAELGSGEPGISAEVCTYLVKRKISIVGSDTWGWNLVTSPSVCSSPLPIATST